MTYVFMLMTSWAIVCDVYYLEPTRIAVSFVDIVYVAIVLPAEPWHPMKLYSSSSLPSPLPSGTESLSTTTI